MRNFFVEVMKHAHGGLAASSRAPDVMAPPEKLLGAAGREVDWAVPPTPESYRGDARKTRGWGMDMQRRVDMIRMARIEAQLASMRAGE
jgi:hypothetical protein